MPNPTAPSSPRTPERRPGLPTVAVRSRPAREAVVGGFCGATLVTLLSVVLVVSFAGCGGAAEGPPGLTGDPGAQGGPPEPTADFRLAVLGDGGEMGPGDFPGRVVVVDFWATWCGPCRKQFAEIEKVYEKLDGDDRVQFLAVDLGEDEETVQAFVHENPFPYPVLMDPEDQLTYDFGIMGLPTMMIVDTEGEVSYFRTGVINQRQLEQEIAAAGVALN